MTSTSLCGLETAFTSDLISEFKNACAMGFGFISFDLFHPKSSRGSETAREVAHLPTTRSDLIFNNQDENLVTSLLGRVSSWIDVDSEVASLRKKSEVAFMKEVTWASHLGVPALSIRIRKQENVNLARLMLSYVLQEACSLRFWLVMPMQLEKEDKEGERCSTWKWWNQIASLAYDAIEHFSVGLILPENLPDTVVIDRWLSEPVACIYLSVNLFQLNSKGYPVLPRAHQAVLRRFFRLNVQVIITGACQHDEGYKIYQKYVAWLNANMGQPDLYDQQSKGLEDQLQEPLQPLKDNLSSATYSIFEMDPYKYKAYEDAVCLALEERARKTEEKRQVVMVLGAGRGPLVKAVLEASDRTGVPVTVFVVEKNPNAVFTLQDRLVNEWTDYDVRLLPGDMRKQTPPELADIFVSELLGSFGDNELSPECLDGAQQYMKENGVSIPTSYTSYLCPIQSQKVHRRATTVPDSGPGARIKMPAETPYVVRLLNCQLLAPPQPVFEFSHPKKNAKDSNERYAVLHFDIKQDSVVHGFAGFFDCVLYGDITMSIHPDRHSPDLISWFPLVFPLDRAYHVRARDRLTTHMWRRVTERDVWYEWACTEPRPTRIFNAGGQAYKMGL